MRKTNTLRACRSLFRIRLAECLQYRIASLSRASIGVFWALIDIVILTVFYTYADNHAAGTNGLSLSQAVTYIWVAQLMVPLYASGIDSTIRTQITNGDVGVELCRPLGLYEHWYAKTAAGVLGDFITRGFFFVLIGVLLPGSLRFGGPASLAGFAVFLASGISAFILSTSLAMLVTMLRLNITWGDGPMHAVLLVAGLLSGTYLPLQLWPDAWQRFLYLQPFAGLIDIPVRFYVGAMAPSEGAFAVGLQLLWAAAFIAAGKAIMRRKTRTLIIQGG